VEDDWSEADQYWKKKEWAKALPALERANGRLVDSGLASIQARIESRLNDVAMATRLESIPLLVVTHILDASTGDTTSIDSAYRSAFDK
jgi:hypothetical protein